MSMQKHNVPYLIFICVIASISGIILGYDASVISGVIDPLTEHLSLTPAKSGWAVSNVILGCIVGAWAAGRVADRFGRKSTLIFTAILFSISAIGSALASDLTWFVVYRMIGGIAVGMASAVTPLYIAEVSPKDLRGRLLGMQQMLMVGGQVVVYVVNYLIARGMPHEWIVSIGWRWMLASALIPCLLFLVLTFFMPESPRWYAMNNMKERSLKILSALSNAEHARRLYAEIRTSIDADSELTRSPTPHGILRDKRSSYILWIGCAIAVLQQLSGINILMYFAPSLLQNVTGNTQDSLFQSIFLGLALLAGVSIALFAFDRIGRIPLLRWGALGCAAFLLLTSWAFMSGTKGYFPVFGLVGYIFVFGMSWSLGTWLLISEIFPNRMRAVAMGYAFCSLWVSNFLVTQTFPMMNRNPALMEHFHGAFPLLLCSVFSIIAYWFVGRFLPETKGVSLEHIEPLMLSKSHRFGHIQRARVIPESVSHK